MGKSVLNSDPFAYKPEYNQQVNGTKVVASPDSKLGENDPFAYRPEYNTEVKKKVGGTESEIGITEPLGTQSESQSKKETATDFLISDINKNDFFNKLASQTDQYFSHTTPQRVNAQAAEMTQKDVFSNPNSLQRYNEQRLKDLNEEINNIDREKSSLTESLIVEGGKPIPIISDPKRYDELSKLALEKQKYKNQLKNSVADLAADMILSQTDLSSPIDVGQVGKKIHAIADPEQDNIIKMAEKNGQTLPGITREQMNYTGLQAIKGYLSRNPNLPNYDQAVKNVNDLERDIDNRSPETTWLRTKEKIGAQIYKEGKGSFFGFGYNPTTLKEVAENPATGLTPTEKQNFYEYGLPIEKRIIGTDIPTSGFTRSFYNQFLEKSPINTVKTIGDFTGLRDESDQARDLLTQEMEGTRYRAPGQSPTAQAQLSYLQDKEKNGKLTDQEQSLKKELENYTYVRNGWSVFKDGVGDLTGQVVFQALLTKGLSGAGNLLTASGAESGLLGGMTRSAVGQAISNETVGLFVTSYLNAYDGYKQQAIQLMPKENQAANRNAYATVMSAVEALSERIFPDTKILNAFTKELAPSIQEITKNFINKGLTQELAKQETQKALKTALKTFGKEYLKSTGEEATEEGLTDVAQGMADSVFGGQDFDIIKTGQQALNTFLTTALYSPLVAGMAARGAVRQQNSQNAFMKSAIVNMAANPAQYLQSVEDLQLNGTITQQEANEKVKLIKSANQYLQEIPLARTVTTKVGEGETAKQVDENKSFDYPETTSYLLHRLNEGILTEQIDNTTDEVLKSKLQKDLKRSQEIRKGLFDGKIGVTTDLNEVTDNPEKAYELGIFDVKQVHPDQLIGTPFEQEKQTENEKESENKTANIERTESEAKTAEAQKAETAKAVNIEELQKVVSDNIENVQGSAKAMLQQAEASELPELFQNIAEQAQDENSANQAIKTFGNEIVNYAKELFPISEQKIATNENKISQEEGSPQKSNEEIGGQQNGQNAGQENDEKGNGVLTEQGAEPTAEAPSIKEEHVKIFNALNKAENKKSEFGKEKAINKAAEKAGEMAAQVKFIHNNFEDIVKQLQDNKKIEQICQ